MLIRPPRNPVWYGLCNQTVTVYHEEVRGKVYTRTVHRRAFLDLNKTERVAKTGSSEASGFLLVIPGDHQAVQVGDKVLLGEGPAVETAAQWADLIPSKVPNLCVVSTVDPKYYRGRIVHTEAGGGR